MSLKLTQIDEWLWHKLLKQPYKLHYIDHGRGKDDNRPIAIFLHGLGSSSATWDLLIPELESKYRCISIDLVGFGQSPKPQWYDYTMEDHISAIIYTIRKLRLRREFTLVGHSLGSLLATRYARLQHKKVERLVLLSPPVYAPIHDFTSRAAIQRTKFYLRAYKFLRNHPKITPENIVKLTVVLPQLKFITFSRETWNPLTRSLEQCIENQTLIEDIGHVHAPVEVFYGRLDEVVVGHNVRHIAKIRDVTLHPLPVSHAVGKRYSQAVAKVLGDFLENNPAYEK
jgi:pimeloyl-ACP methyl ester carboxylesterase